MATTTEPRRESMESSELPSAIEQVREIQNAINKVPPYLPDYKQVYLERAARGEFNKLGSSQSRISMHPTYPVFMRDEAILQKEYLKKLKSKYIETAAKVQFLKFIRKDENHWGAEENEKIEAENTTAKAELREEKLKLQDSFDRAVALARELEAERPELLKETKEADRLAKEVTEMKLELMRLQRDKPVKDRLTIAKAEEILENQITQLQDLDTESRQAQEQAAAAQATRKQLEKEMESLRPAVVQAKAQLRADAAASRTEGREEAEKLSKIVDWYSSAEEMFKDQIGLTAFETPSENEIRLSYDYPLVYSLSLIFHPNTKELADAKISGLDGIDFTEAKELAIAANDCRQLLRYVRLKAVQSTGRSW